jgi:hypothetical protein
VRGFGLEPPENLGYKLELAMGRDGSGFRWVEEIRLGQFRLGQFIYYFFLDFKLILIKLYII